MKLFKRKMLVFILVLVLVLTAFVSIFVTTGESNEDSPQKTEMEIIPQIEKNPENSKIESAKVASLYLGEMEQNNLNDIDSTFSSVFSKLDSEVTVYPSENYLYFRFNSDEKYIWGNIRLAPEERENGLVHFAYYEFKSDLTGPDEANIRHKLLGPEDGITVSKVHDFCYIISYNDKKVIFNLHQIAQTPPKLFDMPSDEEMVFKTYDESGFQYFLIFNKNTKSFYYILNEEESPLQEFERISTDIVVEKNSKFAYYLDSTNQNRKILFGVYGKNVMQNSYYDGPFDQLADNYVTKDSTLSKYIQQAYPYTKGQVDEYGNFLYDDGFRVAIMPYYIYENDYELVEIVEIAKLNSAGSELYSTIAYDIQKDMGTGLDFGLMESTIIVEDGKELNLEELAIPPEPIVPKNDDTLTSTRCSFNWSFNWSSHSKLLSCLPWHVKNVTWKKTNCSWNLSKYHKTNVTWCYHVRNITYPFKHITNVTWPIHTKNATWSKFHIKNVTWWFHKRNVTYAWWHCRNVTWPTHTKTATWSKYHIRNVTWQCHIKNITYPGRHIRNVTWPTHTKNATWSKFHIKNVTWRWHKRCVTYPPGHIKNVTWPTHTRNATWSKFHVKNVTWWPHVKNVTYPWRHVCNVTWPTHTRNATWSKFHIKNVTWRIHIKCVTHPPKHLNNVTWPKHTRNATWSKLHVKNVTWQRHLKCITYPPWHVKRVTWPAHRQNVTWFKSHIRNVTWRAHVKCVTYPYWHIRNVTWPQHIKNVTWTKQHYKCITWLPHKKCVTWTPHGKGVSWAKKFRSFFKQDCSNHYSIIKTMNSCNRYLIKITNINYNINIKKYLKFRHS